MKRRDLLKAFGVGLIAVPVAARANTPKKYGYLDVDAHRAHKNLTGEDLLVYLDGEELERVREVDDVEGYAVVFCRDEAEHRRWDARGALHVGRGFRACTLRVTGNIVIRPGVRGS